MLKSIVTLLIVLPSMTCFAAAKKIQANKSACVTSLSPTGAEILAAWSSNRYAVQSVLFRSLEIGLQRDLRSETPHGAIKRTGKNTYRLKDQFSEIVCRRRVRVRTVFMSQRPVDEFSCESNGPIEEPTLNSNSVAAILFRSISAFEQETRDTWIFNTGRYVVVRTAADISLRCGENPQLNDGTYNCYFYTREELK